MPARWQRVSRLLLMRAARGPRRRPVLQLPMRVYVAQLGLERGAARGPFCLFVAAACPPPHAPPANSAAPRRLLQHHPQHPHMCSQHPRRPRPAPLTCAALSSNCSCNCLAPKVLLLAEGWTQADQLVAALKAELAQLPMPAPYYPGIRQRHDAFRQAYPQVGPRLPACW